MLRKIATGYKPLTICVILILLQVVIQQIENTNALGVASLPHYDPVTPDGVPQLRSLGPAIKWHYDEQQDGSPTSNRRNSDSDLEDSLEDPADDEEDDRDEYARSGSMRHDRYTEEPAYGESQKAAKDGDDIESFFDKHLGPQAAVEGSSDADDNEVPINSAPTRTTEVDHYEAAASSPLSSILQSIISAHKRPFIITTTDDSSPGDDASQQSTSSSTTVASSVSGVTNPAYAGLGAPQAFAAPIAYLTPMVAAPSSTTYDQSNAHQAPSSDSAHGHDDYGPVREIYIARRPLYAAGSQFHAYAPQSHKLEHQSSNAYWRGTVRPFNGDDQADYARFPVAASYAYQREHQSHQPEEEQTVSFGLSFGSRPTESGAGDEPGEGGPDEQSSADESPYGSPYHSSRNIFSHSSSAPRPYNYGPMMLPAGYLRVHPGMMQQQGPFNGARYHRDPAESSPQTSINYGQYSGLSSARVPVIQDTNMALGRQQMLANLDRQNQFNSLYRQGFAATMPRLHFASQHSGNNYPTSNRQNPYSDVDTYKSYHSEVDPYKSLTTTSQIVSDPVGRGRNQVNNNLRVQPTHQSSVNEDQKLKQNSFNNSSTDRSQNNQVSGNQNGKASVSIGSQNAGNSIGDSYTHLDSKRLSPPSNANNYQIRNHKMDNNQGNLRVRRDDSDDREAAEDADDDGVWVDDDEDDDNKQQSSDLNETSQMPEEESESQGRSVSNAPVVIRHGYEISPDNLMVYPG